MERSAVRAQAGFLPLMALLFSGCPIERSLSPESFACGVGGPCDVFVSDGGVVAIADMAGPDPSSFGPDQGVHDTFEMDSGIMRPVDASGDAGVFLQDSEDLDDAPSEVSATGDSETLTDSGELSPDGDDGADLLDQLDEGSENECSVMHRSLPAVHVPIYSWQRRVSTVHER